MPDSGVKSLATIPEEPGFDPKAHMVQELMLEPASVSGDYCVTMLTWGPQELLAHSLTELMGLGVSWAEASGGTGWGVTTQ